MKAFIAYAIVVIGIPYLAGLLFGQIVTLPLSLVVGLCRSRSDESTLAQAFVQAAAWSLSGSTKGLVADHILHICMDVFNGFGAFLAAGLIFHMFGLYPGVSVLLILGAWEIFFTVAYGQSYRGLFSTLAGIVVGRFVVRWLWNAA